MLRYDKDMERVMLEKKIEVIKELEEHKTRILKELSGVDKMTLTRLREILADYNNINYYITTKINDIELKVNNNVMTVSEGFERIEEIRTELLEALEEVKKLENIEGLEAFESRISKLESDLRNTNSGLANYNDRINQNAFAIEMANMNLQNLSGVPSALETISSDVLNLSNRIDSEVVNLKLFLLELEVGNGVTHNFNETSQTHTFSATWSKTGFKVGNNIDLSQIITLCGVYPSSLNNGGGGWTNFNFEFYNTGSNMGFKVETKNHGNNGDIPEKVYLRFLISETPIN